MEEYKPWVPDHLLKAVGLAFSLKLIALFEDANTLLQKMKMELSIQEKFDR